MVYSDQPIKKSISEDLADIYQDANELRQANEAAASYTQQDVSLLCKKYDGLRQKLQEYTGEVYL